jgi:hypothetical protein
MLAAWLTTLPGTGGARGAPRMKLAFVGADADRQWLTAVLDRISHDFGSRVDLRPDGMLALPGASLSGTVSKMRNRSDARAWGLPLPIPRPCTRLPLRRVMWVDLLAGEADTQEGVRGDGRGGAGEEAPEGVRAVAG